MENDTAIPSYCAMGDQALVVQFENEISIPVSRRVQSFAQRIKQHQVPGIVQLLPAFNNVTICYDPVAIGYEQLKEKLRYLEEAGAADAAFESRTVHFPVVFGGEYGPDIDEIASHAGLSAEEIVSALHEQPYYVYMIGFIAGYPYCGDVDKRLSLPRRANPRGKVPKGAVQIVNNLTGIFTMTAPSGWHVVGWTPTELFDPHREAPSLLQAGDYIQYVPIRAEEAEGWDGKKQREWDLAWNS